jgi:hypothetical protein
MRVRRSIVLALLVAAPAFAQQTSPRTLAEELQGEALTAFDQGRALFEHGDYATAHAKFRAALEASSNPRLLWNMAACSSKQKRYARAIDEAERFVAEGGTALGDDQVGRAVNFVREMKTYVAEATFTVEPAEAVLSVDRQVRPLKSGAASVLLEVGDHELLVEREGFEPLRETLAVSTPKAFSRTLKLRAIVTTARLVVDAPADAVIELDGTSVARGRFEGSVDPGVHRLRVHAEGRESYASVIDLNAGSAKVLTVSLVDASASRPWWPWVLGGTALACGAAVGGYFLFKPEATQEPQVPGTLGSIYLR